eukprot:54611-Eustigmatos_ZCMA.PRE.1
MENDLLVVAHAFLDVDFQQLPFLHHLAAAALLALVLLRHGLARTLAHRARRLDLLHHARSNLSELDLYTASAAVVACLLRSGLAPKTIARPTELVTIDRQMAFLAVVQVIQCDLQGMATWPQK